MRRAGKGDASQRAGLFAAEGVAMDYVAHTDLGLPAEKIRCPAVISAAPLGTGLAIDCLSRKFRRER